MSMEGVPSPEEIREATIIEELRSTTPEELIDLISAAMSEREKIIPRDAEKIKEYISWEKENEASLENIPEGIERETERMRLEIRRADFYQKAALTALARETLDNALLAAYGLEDIELADMIQEKLDALEE
jgi:hypothetical protein